MKLEAEQVLCRVQLSSRARHGTQPLYEWIVETARREELQGATVLRGVMGLRSASNPGRDHPFRVSHDGPVVVEIVDGPRHVEKLLALVEPAMQSGLITLERARVALYRGGAGDAQGRDTAPRCDVVATRDASAALEVRTMKVAEPGVLLRVFLGESDRDARQDRPLYEAIVQRAREANLAGATVLRGPLGFGRHSRLHSAKLFELSSDLPIVVEIVDSPQKIEAFLPIVDELVSEGLVTLEAVRVLKYAGSADTR